jgi:hypothetical protein
MLAMWHLLHSVPGAAYHHPWQSAVRSVSSMHRIFPPALGDLFSGTLTTALLRSRLHRLVYCLCALSLPFAQLFEYVETVGERVDEV